MTGKRILERMLTMMMLLLLLSGASWAQGRAPQGSMGTAFTYQGYLTDTGGPVNATCDFTFGLYSAANDGTLLGTETADDLDVKEGLFPVQLNFGPGAFAGEARWLEITVDCGAGPAVLGPRQELTPTPYALYAAAAPWSGLDGVPPGFADSVDDDTTYGAGRGLTLSDTTFAISSSMMWVTPSRVCSASPSGTSMITSSWIAETRRPGYLSASVSIASFIPSAARPWTGVLTPVENLSHQEASPGRRRRRPTRVLTSLSRPFAFRRFLSCHASIFG